MMMPMFFNTSKEIIFIFEGLESKDGAGYTVGWIITLLLAILVEGLLYFRSYLALWLQIRLIKKTLQKVEPKDDM